MHVRGSRQLCKLVGHSFLFSLENLTTAKPTRMEGLRIERVRRDLVSERQPIRPDKYVASRVLGGHAHSDRVDSAACLVMKTSIFGDSR